ncbi:cell division protein FtsQ/DivIB [Mycoavidus sp. B2-EB]|uniref:cell division protein FtsQ/DivIB n=1 Tax=Mycoavidus sp. B2-EB TaxID=2651972 RepID=UPI00162624DF|nr:cell division protein FtsQ/DivIB [Mycoavidus sp. B2-EB]BBO60280.1 cell division protein FtsQ [Mycoavidus sp. B2-EB]
MWRNFRQLNLLANLLGACGVLILLMSLASWLNRQPIFALRALRIEGATSHLSLQGARAIISQLRGNFFTLDLDAARAAFESMPWVRHASVRRIWPNRLTVTLDEYTPLGTWGNDWLVSTQGERFSANLAEAGDDLPVFNGPPGSEQQVVARYHDFKRWLVPLGSRVQEVTLSPRYAWSVELANGMSIELGREPSGDLNEDTLAQRCSRLVAAWQYLIQQWGTQIEYVDLRYPNGFAVRVAGMQFAPPGE